MQNRRSWCTSCALALTMSVLGVVVGCEADRPVRPQRVTDNRPSESHSPQRPPSTTVDLPIPANSVAPLNGGTDLIPTGIVVREGLNMRLRMPSTMNVTHNLGMRIECHFWWVPVTVALS